MEKKTEDRLLLHLIGLGDCEIEPARLEQSSESDWLELVRQSRMHGVTPLLYYRLKTSGLTAHIPTEVKQTLRKTYLYSAQRNTRIYDELPKVLAALQNARITVIVLKGAALAELVYQDIASRPMSDIDLLVRDEDIRRIDGVLPLLGYGNIEFSLSERHAQCLRHVRYRNGGVQIEMHPKMFELPDLDPWINASHANIASTDTLVLGSEDLLLHLCLHLDQALRAEFPMLIWWYDIAKFLERWQGGLNWDYVVRIAREHDVGGAMRRILTVVYADLGGRVPVDVLNQLKDDGIAISIDDILQCVDQPAEQIGSSLLAMSRIPSVRSKVYYVLRKIFPRREFLVHRYSVERPGFVYFYYPVHVLRTVAKAVKTFCQLPAYMKSKR